MKEIENYLELRESELEFLQNKVDRQLDSGRFSFSKDMESLVFLRGEIKGIKECLRYTNMLMIKRAKEN